MSVGQIKGSVFPPSEAEAARLSHLNGLLTRVQGGVPEMAGFTKILDLACGAGSWVFEVARAYPHLSLMGVDDGPLMIEIAREQALVAGSGALPLPNVTFHLEANLTRMDLVSEAFDFIHAQSLVPRMTGLTWPGLMKECYRLLIPGGVAQFIVWELPVTSGSACERYFELIGKAFYHAGRSLAGGARAIGISAALPHLFRAAGFATVHCQATLLDFSRDAPEHAAVFQSALVGLRYIQPFLLAYGIATGEEIERLYQQAMAEMQADDFTGSLVVLAVRGKKPVR